MVILLAALAHRSTSYGRTKGRDLRTSANDLLRLGIITSLLLADVALKAMNDVVGFYSRVSGSQYRGRIPYMWPPICGRCGLVTWGTTPDITSPL